MTPTVAFIGAKGGTLKSACTLSIATQFARRGLRVAVVDCDPQATTTRALPGTGEDGEEVPFRTVADPLEAPPVEVMLEQVRALGGTMMLFRSGPLLWKARQDEIVRHIQRAQAIADVVLVDTVPVLGDISLASATAAQLVVIPTAPTADDLDAVDHVVAAIQESVDPAKQIRIVLTKVIAGRRNSRDALELLTEKFPNQLYSTTIPHRTTGETANMYLRPAILYDAIVGDGSLATAYKALTEEIAADIGMPAARKPHVGASKEARSNRGASV